ncbi:enoyl-CoA hydratase/isomerase family protein [Mycobacterium branderi]|nr:enoyl-CoA hydratase-related protein [Mycobacterium branderi]MCV7231751.1 enoyl-CoA hydratase/isomerase family protein [Mycobacterium branderi]ORA40282.1 hypothetical protein BST20_06950 [Mycobacterium branderi]
MAVWLDRNDRVAWVHLDKPETLNALAPDDFAHLAELFDEIARTPSDRAMVIVGEGKAFCAGANLSEVNRDEHVLHLMRRIHAAAANLHKMSKPSIAAVHGVAAGAGANLALGCDLVVATRTASFCQVFVKRGLSPDFGGTWLLPRLVGMQMAKQLAMLGDTVDAETALRIGLVCAVVADDELHSYTDALARRLADGPPIALAQTKQLFGRAATNSFDEQLDAEAAAVAINVATEDCAEGITAFLERRSPVFRGR